MKIDDRVQIVESVWPERVGCIGTIVEPPTKGFVLVKLDDDPMTSPKGRAWSCIVGRSTLRILDHT